MKTEFAHLAAMTRLTALFSLALTGSALAGVLPNDAVVDGRTIGDWSAEWWKWIFPIPTSQNPDLDTNGTFAAVGQPGGDVFFIAQELGIVPGAIYNRAFTVPEGKYLFFPLLVYEDDNVDTIPPLSVADLRAQAAGITDDIKELHATLDGVDIPNLFDHRAISPVFNIFYTDPDNLEAYAFGHPITGLNDPMICDGYWLMLQPLTLGPHVLRFGGSYSNAFFIPIDVLDNITVVPVNHPPVADASATPVRAISPDNHNAKVVLDGSRSSDPDNDPLTYSWLEGASVLSKAVVSTNILSVGTHAISLVVSDGKLSDTNTTTLNVITLEEAVRQLASMVQGSSLALKNKRPLLDPLEDAEAAFRHGHVAGALHELAEFQKKVHEHAARANPALAQEFSQAAQEIIDAANQPPLPVVLPNDAIVDGKTIGDWSAEWWKWILPISISQNPDLDTNGAFAAVGQPGGDVFFIAHELGIIPGTYTRAFAVPEGKYLFFPLELYEADNVDSVPLPVADLRAQAAAIIDDTRDIYANIDGIDLPNPFDHRAISPVFNLLYTNADNIHTFAFGHPVTGLIDPMVCDGYWLMLQPLAPGPHVLHFGGSFSNAFFFASDILDYITVVPMPPPQLIQELVLAVEASSLPMKRQRELVEELQEAGKAFARNHLREGIEELREFQRKVRHEIGALDAPLAEQFIQAAQTIIERAQAQLR